jgi:hypothetical protein
MILTQQFFESRNAADFKSFLFAACVTLQVVRQWAVMAAT